MTTKAQLEAQVTELQEQLAAAQAATPDSAPRLPGFANRIWLPKSLDEVVTLADGKTFKPVRYGTTNNGSRFIEWTAQLSSLDKKTGNRIYSKAKFAFKAWNEQCDQVIELINAGNRLVDVTANFLPDVWSYEGIQYTKDFWFVLSVDPLERDEQPEAQAEIQF